MLLEKKKYASYTKNNFNKIKIAQMRIYPKRRTKLLDYYRNNNYRK
jgi:hypothetical protein